MIPSPPGKHEYPASVNAPKAPYVPMPMLLHCPSGTSRAARHAFFRRLVPYYSCNWEPCDGKLVEVITYNNGKVPFAVEAQLEKMGVHYHVLAKDVHPWRFSAKILPVLKYLESGAVRGPYILLIDGNDTVFTRSPTEQEIATGIAAYAPSKVLFCSTPANWPPNKRCRDFELSLYPKPNCHLSTGAYTGDIDTVIEGLRWIVNRMASRGNAFDDQLAWRKAHLLSLISIGVDYKCSLFRRCGDLR